jgi:hypothetical protein
VYIKILNELNFKRNRLNRKILEERSEIHKEYIE